MNKAILTGFITLARKECRRTLRIWQQTLVPPAITMLLYFLIFGSFIGSQIGTVQGVSYVDFIAPGFIMMACITNTYGSVSSSLFIQKLQRSIEDLITSPLPNFILLWGFLVGGLFRGILIAIIVSIVASFFTTLTFDHWIALIIGLFLTLLPLSLAGFINGILARKFDDLSLIPTFILTPLTYLGGVFYPLNHLQGIWHQLSLFNPIVYMVNIFRFEMLGVSDVPIGHCFAVLISLTVTLYGIAAILLARGKGIKN